MAGGSRLSRVNGWLAGLPTCKLGLYSHTVYLLTSSTIGTYQTLNNVERLRKFDSERTKLVIVDEAHHAAAFS
jgi:superfamily II DNA or RNA helicase